MPDGTPRQGNPVHRTNRLFVALVPPAAVVAPLAAAVAPLRAAHPALAWVAPQRWHLTLVFLRHLPQAVRPALSERLARVAHRHGPFEVAIGGAGRFGQRALWVHAHGGLRPLATAVGRAAG